MLELVSGYEITVLAVHFHVQDRNQTSRPKINMKQGKIHSEKKKRNGDRTHENLFFWSSTLTIPRGKKIAEKPILNVEDILLKA